MPDESFQLVRDGDLTVHILIGGDAEAGEDPDWNVAMCGHSLGDDRSEWGDLEHSMTVGDMCALCFLSFAQVYSEGR